MIDDVRSRASGYGKTSQRYISEAYTALATGDNEYDFNLLTNKEKRAVAKINRQRLNQTTPIAGTFSELMPEEMFGNFNLAMGETEDRSKERMVKDTQDYNNVLAEQAKALETSQTALKLYGAAMKNAGTLTKETTKETAEAIANSYKFNKAYNEAVKVYKNNEDAIKD